MISVLEHNSTRLYEKSLLRQKLEPLFEYSSRPTHVIRVGAFTEFR